MADIQNIDDYKIDIKGTTYSLIKLPPDDSDIVKEQTGAILGTLRLDELVEGLDKSRELLRCAYNGVAGFGKLRGDVIGLQDDLAQLCRKSIESLAVFERCSKDVLSNMSNTFRHLVNPNEIELGLKYLKRCSNSARDLSKRADELSKEFDALAEKTIATTQATELAKGLSEQQQRDFEQAAASLKAQIAEADTAQQELTKLCDKLQKKYEEAHSSAEKEADRAFTISLVGAIMKPLAAGLGSAAAAYGASRTGGITQLAGALNNSRQSDPTNPTAGESTTPTESGSGEEASSTETQSKETAETATSETKSGTSAETKTGSDSHAGKQAALEGAASTAKEAAESMDKLSDKMDERAKSARDLELQVLQLQQQAEISRIAQAGLLAKFAVQLSNTKDQIQVTGATVYSLYIAVGALKKVAVVLRDAAMFWEQMRAFCDVLNNPNSGFQSDVDMLKDDPAELIKMLRTDVDVKTNVVVYYASWMAIQQVTKEFQATVAKVREGIKKDFKENPTTQESISLARELGSKLYLDSQAEIASATHDRDAIAKQITEQPKAA